MSFAPSSDVRTISFVLPVYNGAGTVPALHAALSEVMDALGPGYAADFIYVDDGSRDESAAVIRGIAERDKRARAVILARNFGHQMSLTAGLDRAFGDAVVVMDTDMQDPPWLVKDLVDAWNEGWDVVYAQRTSRRDPARKRLASWLFYRLLARMADVEIPKDTGEFRLMDQQVVRELRSMREYNRFLRGMVSFLGFRQTAVQFDRDERAAGESGYTLRKLLHLAADGITSFSSKPLRLIASLGLAVAALSCVGILYALALFFFVPTVKVPGWTLMIIAIFFMGGVQMLTLGVVGAYVGKIYAQVQQRPLYVVAKEVGGSSAPGPGVVTSQAGTEVAAAPRTSGGELLAR